VLDEAKITLIEYRLEQAEKCIDAASLLVDAGAYKDAANRIYYAVFHAMRAVLALDGFDSKKHSGIISAFQQKYIKTSVFPPDISKTIRNTFIARGKSDYEDFFVISKEETIQQLENSKAFVIAVKSYINSISTS
jgi:uncharacterized protein (UPF0332 family)